MQSISSSLMTTITSWRNPLGAEKCWLYKQEQSTTIPSWEKLTFSEVGFGLTFVISVIEVIAFSSLSIITYFFSCCFYKPFSFSFKCLKSSAVSMTWSFGCLFANFIYPNLVTSNEQACNKFLEFMLFVPENKL
jgi:hypothetical protein